MITGRDPSAARLRILAAAAAEFAEHGYAGGRIDRIAAAARLNKRMLYHYFGNKRGLFLAALTSRLGAGVDPRGEPPADPVAARLLLWALLEPTTAAVARRLAALDEADPAGWTRAWRRLGAALEPHARLPARKPRVRLKR